MQEKLEKYITQILNTEKAWSVQNIHLIRNIGRFFSFKNPSQLEIRPIRNRLNRGVSVVLNNRHDSKSEDS